MKRVVPARRWIAMVFTCAGVLAALAIGACTPNAAGVLISPDMGTQLAAQEAGKVVSAVPTKVPPTIAELTPEQIYAGLPPDLVAAASNADISKAPAIATARGCIGCHSLDPNAKMTGPTWFNVGNTAITRVPGTGPAEYIHQSIINPNAFVVPGFPSGVMPQTYGQQLSPDELGTMIAYLLSQQGKK